MSFVSGILLVVLFAAPEYFYPVFYTAVALYCLQIVYYVALFTKEYRRYRNRFDNYFAGDEYRRLRWIRDSFWMATGVGIAAGASLFVNPQLYIVFTVGYTVFYVYFAIKFIGYITLFHRIAPVVTESDGHSEQTGKESGNKLRVLVEQWLENKSYLSADISLESLAQRLDTNPAYLSRHINTQYGQNFRSWVNSLRIAEAQRIITESDGLSLPEIGEKVGIPSISTFYRQFAAVTGIAPVEYRKKFGNGSQTE